MAISTAYAGSVHQIEPTKNPERQLIVRFKSGTTQIKQLQALGRWGHARKLNAHAALARQGTRGGVTDSMHLLEVNEGISVSEAIASLQKNSAVLYAEPNRRVKLFQSTEIVPNDLQYDKLYGMHWADTNKTRADIDAPTAWQISTGDRKIIVAVIDTGIDYFHEDLRANIWTNSGEIPGNGIDDDGNGYIDDVHGYDFVTDDSDPMDDHMHGTHVAGTIGALGNNEIGVVGVCWQVSLMAIKAFDETGNSTLSQILEAIDYAIVNGARVINASWGIDEESHALHEAVQKATDAGIIFVAAAGNEKTDSPAYPAAYDEALAIAALDSNSARAGFSNYGPWVDLAAPGVDIYSTVPASNYDYLSGTSMATPHVTGLAALVLAHHPEFTRSEVQNILLNTADLLPVDRLIGRGRINAGKALAIDTPLPFAKLSVPDRVHGLIDLGGDANGRGFSGYTLSWGPGQYPATWHDFYGAKQLVTSGMLASNIDSSIFPEGLVTIRLSVTNSVGQSAFDFTQTKVENVRISLPFSGDVLRAGEKYEIHGTLFGQQRAYQLFYGRGFSPSTWTQFTGGDATNILDGLLGVWDTSGVSSNEVYALRLVGYNGTGTNEYVSKAIFLDGHLKPGWPIYLPVDEDFPTSEWRNIRATDLDGDGKSEIIVVNPGGENLPDLRVYDLSGKLLWSQQLAAGPPYSDIPVIGDMDGDGKPEIFADTGTQLYGFKNDGQPLGGNWPLTVAPGNLAKVIGDVKQDGHPNLITFSQDSTPYNGSDMRALNIYDSSGALLRQWRIPWCGFTNDVQKIFPALANMDDDPDLEIVTPWGCSEIACFKFSNTNGPIWTAPVSGQIVSSPAIGDIDGDGSNDVVVATAADQNGIRGGLFIFDSHGQLWPGWPLLGECSFESSPSLCDLDRDGRLEISIPSVTPQQIHLIQWDGFEADGWPISIEKTSVRGGTTIGDVDGDGRADVVFASSGSLFVSLIGGDPESMGGVFAWDFSGKELPINGDGRGAGLLFESSVRSWRKAMPPLLGDLDGDGKLDILCASIQDRTYGGVAALKRRSSVYVWGLDTPVAKDLPNWPMMGFDPANNNFYAWPIATNGPGGKQTKAIQDRFIIMEDESRLIAPLANDRNNTTNPLALVSFTQPANGSVTQTDPTHLLYSPKTNFSGIDEFTYSIRDSAGTESSAKIRLLLKPVNDPPTVSDIQVQLNRNASVDIIYNGYDPEGDHLTYSTPVAPLHGELWNYPAVGTYYPATNYTGTDSFTFTASDGKLESAPATVTVTITDTNNPPKALGQAITVKTNGSALIHLSGTDRDKDPLTFAITQDPKHGTLVAEAKGYRYTPETDFLGPDSFSFVADDGRDKSKPADVQITVTDGNTAPTAVSANYDVRPNVSTDIILGGVDAENDDLTFRLLTEPAHGALTGELPNVTYTPEKDFLGQDRFTFTVMDQKFESSPGTISLRVTRQNSPPIANDQAFNTVTNLPVQFALNAFDNDHDSLEGIILKGPAHGRVFGLGTNWTYIPKPGYAGLDFFTYRLWDGKSYSKDAKVAITIDTFIPLPQALGFQQLTIDREAGNVQVRLKVPPNITFAVEISDDLQIWRTILPNASSVTTDYSFEILYLPDTNSYFRAHVLP
jgi:subtilisin family serine protease